MSKTEGFSAIFDVHVALLTDRWMYRNRLLDGWMAVKFVQLVKVVEFVK